MWIYVIHFDEQLSHASHYVGRTTNLSRRLSEHANGSGATILAELKERNISWRLGNVFQVTNENADRVEAALKKERNVPLHCSICAKKPLPVKNALTYPLKNLSIPKTSRSIGKLKDNSLFPLRFNVMVTRAIHAPSHAISVIAELDTPDLEPPSSMTPDPSIIGSVTLAHDDGRLRLLYIDVDENLRLNQVARAMINAIAASFPFTTIVADVSDASETHPFFEAVGFSKIREITIDEKSHFHYARPPEGVKNV